MIALSKSIKLVILVLVAADFMIFSRITILPLVAMMVGVALSGIGIESSYRPASLFGLLIITTTAATSIEIPSLLDIGDIMIAFIGILLPSLAMIWLALSIEEGETLEVLFMKGPTAISLGYALVCVWSAPLVILVLSFFLPTVSTRVTILSEISIILVTAIAGAVFILRKRPLTVVLPAKGSKV